MALLCMAAMGCALVAGLKVISMSELGPSSAHLARLPFLNFPAEPSAIALGAAAAGLAALLTARALLDLLGMAAGRPPSA